MKERRMARVRMNPASAQGRLIGWEFEALDAHAARVLAQFSGGVAPAGPIVLDPLEAKALAMTLRVKNVEIVNRVA